MFRKTDSQGNYVDPEKGYLQTIETIRSKNLWQT